MADQHTDPAKALRKALEQTVPAAEFSPESLKRLAEQTVADEESSVKADRFLRRTASDHQDTALTDTITRFGDTSEVPVQLAEEMEAGGARFALLDRIGSGATSHVYAVRDHSLERTIAVKFLKRSRSLAQTSRRRFLHEARVTAQLEHPNIMPIHDIGLDSQGRLFFVMKRVEGHTVGDAIRTARGDPTATEPAPTDKGPGHDTVGFDSVDDKLEIFFKLCDAVAFAHDHGYIHQDIKPDNIMLGRYGEVLLLDWGCALDRHLESDDTGKAIYGTPAYMSPEQARREQADERSDIYCVGATLYHVLTLHHPTWADDPETFWAMKSAGELSPLPHDADDVPAPLLEICRTAMAPDPADRYQTVGQMRQAVREYQSHADSIVLASAARDRLESAVATGSYQAFVEILHDLRQALRMWPANGDASDAEISAKQAYAACALDRRDLQLAATLIDDTPAFDGLRARLQSARAAEAGRRRRTRQAQGAAFVLALAVLAFLAYLGMDSFKYFGSWHTLYHWNPSKGKPVGVTRAVSVLRTTQTSADSVHFDGTSMEIGTQAMYWLEDLRVSTDVRFEAHIMWPEYVDGFEVHLQARRAESPEWPMLLGGFSCQFGSGRGQYNYISRNDFARWPSMDNAVAAAFEPQRWYRVAFERHGDQVNLYVDGKKVLSQSELLPLPGSSFEHIAFRSWGPLRIRSLTVRRMTLPRKASPLVVGDAAIVRADYEDAVRQYLRLADDFVGNAIGERALAKAYLSLNMMGRREPDSLRASIRDRLERRYPDSEYWPLLNQYDCLTAWTARDYDRALGLLGDVYDQNPDTRLALRLVGLFDGTIPPQDVTRRLLSFVGRTRGVIRLNLDRWGLRDLEFARDMPLQSLSIKDNRVASLEPLKGMPLKELTVGMNDIEDLSPLKGMPLRSLDISANAVSSLEPLRGAPLRKLYVADNHVTDLSPLAGMQLTDLTMSSNAITSLEPLRDMPLVSLNASYTGITSVEPLRGIPLTSLQIQHTDVSSLEPLRDMPITGLNASATPITDFRPVKSLDSLKDLHVPSGLRDLCASLPLHSLKTLTCDSLRAQDLSCLASSEITRLGLPYASVSDLSPLKDLTLSELRLPGSQVRELPQFGMGALEELVISGTPIGDLSRLKGTHLSQLNIRHSAVRNLLPLAESPPRALVLDCEAFDAQHVERIIRRWRRYGDTAQATCLEVNLAVSRGDLTRARSRRFAALGHHYLLVPKPRSYAQADSICGELGAHMVTITSFAESDVIRSLQRSTRTQNIWLGFPPTTRPDHWVTGEPVTFRRFNETCSPGDTLRWYVLEGNAHGWFHNKRSPVEAGFVAEWDE